MQEIGKEINHGMFMKFATLKRREKLACNYAHVLRTSINTYIISEKSCVTTSVRDCLIRPFGRIRECIVSYVCLDGQGESSIP